MYKTVPLTSQSRSSVDILLLQYQVVKLSLLLTLSFSQMRKSSLLEGSMSFHRMTWQGMKTWKMHTTVEVLTGWYVGQKMSTFLQVKNWARFDWKGFFRCQGYNVPIVSKPFQSLYFSVPTLHKNKSLKCHWNNNKPLTKLHFQSKFGLGVTWESQCVLTLITSITVAPKKSFQNDSQT